MDPITFSILEFVQYNLRNATKEITMDSVSSLRRYLNLKNTLNQNLLEDYTKAINERPRRIHGYQSAKKLFELTQTA